MIPRTALELSPALPPDHTGWTPKKEDLSEEGFAYFRDTWLIRGVRVGEAKQIMALESKLVGLIGQLSRDIADFDLLSSTLEDGQTEELPQRLTSHAAFAELDPYICDEAALEGPEVGVSGLVHALSAVGCWPAASCRGHPTEHAWADHPVVYLAADSHRATVLQPLVESVGCGFNTDPARSKLIVIESESIEDMMALATVVISAHRTFVPKRALRRSTHGEAGDQLTLDFGP